MPEDFVDMSFPAFETPLEKRQRIADLKLKLEQIRAGSGDKPYEAVKKFHETMGQPVGDKPQFLPGPRLAFRLSLIQEEYKEFIDAVMEQDLANAFKELADLVYVIEGLAVEMGGNLDEVFKEVHRSNMTKIDEKGEVKYREDGKVLKPDTYSPADIERVLGL